MSEDVKCPYCKEWQEINHDDGYGCEDGGPYEQECGDCEKTFIYYTNISFDYNAHAAPCLNEEADHLYKYNWIYPARNRAELSCTCCKKTINVTQEEAKKLAGDVPPGSYTLR